jgi:hypothetical protein
MLTILYLINSFNKLTLSNYISQINMFSFLLRACVCDLVDINWLMRWWNHRLNSRCHRGSKIVNWCFISNSVNLTSPLHTHPHLIFLYVYDRVSVIVYIKIKICMFDISSNIYKYDLQRCKFPIIGKICCHISFITLITLIT